MLYDKGNEYIESNNWEKAIESFQSVLTLENCNEEKYSSCLKLFDIYEKLEKTEEGLSYLLDSYKYDTERVECIFRLIRHYSCQKKHNLAFEKYQHIQEYYEQRYLDDTTICTRLNFEQSVYSFFLPYHMIIVSERTGNYLTGVKMYEMIFRQKYCPENWYIQNLIYNFQFFLSHVPKQNTTFVDVYIGYLNFLHESTISLDLGLVKRYINELAPGRSKEICVLGEKCKESKKILFYCGFSISPWNHTTMVEKGVGGSETCVAKLAMQFPSD